MVTEFNLTSEIKQNCVVMKTAGYINNNGGQKIVDEFYKQNENGITNVVLDLAETNVVNSIGISFLIEMIEKLNDNDGKLIFINLDPSIEKTFTIMGLFHYAAKANDIDEALKLV